MKRLLPLLLLSLLFANLFGQGATVRAADDGQFFPETGFSVSGKFLAYWRQNGGLPVFGYPITAAQNELNPEDGQTYLTQWFERNRFEYHPEKTGTPFEVELGLLGKDLRREALDVDPDFQRAEPLYDPSFPPAQQLYFNETGHNLRFQFLTYWQQNGGLSRFGYPLAEEHYEVDAETGKVFLMQWLERARFEYHPENPPATRILLGLLGNQIKRPKPGFEYAWKIGGNKNTGLNRPSGIAVDAQGNIFLADSRNHRILKYSATGNLLAQFGKQGAAEGQFNQPEDVAVDQQGNIYVTDTFNYRVQKFDPTGKFLMKFGSYGQNDGQFARYCYLAIGIDGSIFVSDTLTERIQKFDTQGNFISKIGGKGEGDYQFYGLADIAIDKEGNIFAVVSQYGAPQVRKYDQNFNFLLRFSDFDHGKAISLVNPFAITIDEQNNIYVTYRGGNYLEYGVFDFLTKFDSNGNYIQDFNNPKDISLESTGQIAADKGGSIFVIDSSSTSSGEDKFGVQKYSTTGQFIAQFGYQTDPDPFLYNSTAGVASDADGNVYYNNQAVFKYDSKGKLVARFDFPAIDISYNIYTGVGGIAIDLQGNIYAVANQTVYKFDSNGKVLGSFGKLNRTDYGQYIASYLATDKAGNIYLADPYRGGVQKFSPDGKLILEFGRTGNRYDDNTWVTEPQGLVIDQQNNIYVLDASYRRVQKFDSQGNFLLKFGEYREDERGLYYPVGLAMDKQGNFYIGDKLQGNIKKFSNSGQFLSVFGGFGEGDGQFLLPQGLSLDNQNNLYISDRIGNRLIKLWQR